MSINEEFDIFCSSQGDCVECKFNFCKTSEECREHFRYNYMGNAKIVEHLQAIEGKFDELIKLIKEKY